MKRFTLFTRIKNRLSDKEFWKYTLFFFAMMVLLYIFLVFVGGFSSPEFTYAEF